MVKPTSPPKSLTGQYLTVPSGAPDWVTPDLLAHTLDVWQPYSRTELSVDDAMEILLNVGQLMRVLSNSPVDHRE